MIEVSNLGKSFNARIGRARTQVRAIDDVSFVAPDGHITALLGPNGAGKTTTLRILATLMPPDHGSAMLYYKDAALAAYMLLAAPADKIKMVNYNVGGVRRVTPRELENALKKHAPALTVSYVTPPGPPMPGRGEIAWDDSYARSEWGWTPQFTDVDRVVTDFVQEMKDPRRHGLG